MSIFDISLSELTDEYISYLNEMTEQNLEVTSEFVVMAATLLDIKARKLLPELEPKEDEEDSVSEEDIISRIVEYKKYKEIANIINDMYCDYFGSFSKPFEKIKYKEKAAYTGQYINKNELFDLYINVLKRNVNKVNKKAEEIEKIAIYEKVKVKDKVKQIVDYLQYNDNLVFNDMFNVNKCDNIEVATAFLGVLELSKLKQVDIEQEYSFSDINVSKRNDVDLKIDLSNIIE
jgi:segregation and condensation protein A